MDEDETEEEQQGAAAGGSVSSSLTDLHALAAFGELQSLQQRISEAVAAAAYPLSSPCSPFSFQSLINERDTHGLTLLHSACQQGQAQVVQWLLSETADVCLQDGGGQTALHVASGGGHEASVRLLLAACRASGRSCLDVQDADGRTALHWAAMHEHDAVVAALIAAGASTDIRDSRGHTPLRWLTAFKSKLTLTGQA